MTNRKYKTAPEDERPTIGVGMLGYGFMGKTHTNAFRTIPHVFWPDGVRADLVALSGRTEPSLREASIRYGFRSYTTDWRTIVTDDRISVFDNVGPDKIHFEPTLAAIEAGHHVICEKPLAGNPGHACRLFQAADQAGVKHLTCFNYRFLPAVRLAYDLIKGGDLGEIIQSRFRYSLDWRLPSDASLPYPTGALAIVGCHAIDQARFLVGEIGRVSAKITAPVTRPSRKWRGETVEQVDTVTVLAEFTDKTTGLIDASLVAAGRKNMLAWEINCSRGTVIWSLEDLNRLKIYRTNGSGGFADAITCEPYHPLASPWWASGHLLGWEHGHINMVAHFLEAVAADSTVGPYGATFEDGAQAALVADAVVRAAATNEWVTVPPLKDQRSRIGG